MSRAEARNVIDEILKQNRVVIFSKSYCPYCTRAKKAIYELLDAAKVCILEIENRPDMNSLQDELGAMTGARSVPRVFVDGEFIGGGDDTAAKAANGELKTLLSSKGIA